MRELSQLQTIVEITDWQRYVKGAAQEESFYFSRSTAFKVADNEFVAMDVLVRICKALGCGMDDIVEMEKQ